MTSQASLANLKPWQPGQSGNSVGAARGFRRVLAIARKASPEAMQTAVECMQDKNASWRERLTAVAMILDRAHGAPNKLLQLDTHDGLSALRIEFVAQGQPDQAIIISHTKANGHDEDTTTFAMTIDADGDAPS